MCIRDRFKMCLLNNIKDKWISVLSSILNSSSFRSAWVAQLSIQLLVLAQVIRLSPASGSVLDGEPAWDSLSHPLYLSLSAPPQKKKSSSFKIAEQKVMENFCRDAWMAQRLRVCLWLRVWSRSPGIESHIGLLAWTLLLLLPMSLPLSLCLSWIHKIFKKK